MADSQMWLRAVCARSRAEAVHALAGERTAACHWHGAAPEAALWRRLPGDHYHCLCSALHTGCLTQQKTSCREMDQGC